MARPKGKRGSIYDGDIKRGFNKELGRWVSAQRRRMQASAKKIKKRINGQIVEVTVYPPADVTGDRLGSRATARPKGRS